MVMQCFEGFMFQQLSKSAIYSVSGNWWEISQTVWRRLQFTPLREQDILNRAMDYFRIQHALDLQVCLALQSQLVANCAQEYRQSYDSPEMISMLYKAEATMCTLARVSS